MITNKRKQWEYLIGLTQKKQNFEYVNYSRLKELGMEGWELICITDAGQIIFKREKLEKNEKNDD